MQIVIDISEELYQMCRSCLGDADCIESAIANGTPLPKGHGRLIDADSIYQIVRPIEQSDAEWGMTAETAKRLILDAFDNAPTIIEADKESEE